MNRSSLRHLRVLLAVADTGSVTQAAQICAVSQPAVTQALHKLEAAAGGALFDRTRRGVHATPRGQVLIRRVRRALGRIDPALADAAPRLVRTATTAQLHALSAVAETGNFTLAARRLGLAQPTVHRAVAVLESDAGRRLFDRLPQGITATRVARSLGLAARLAFAELDQAAADLADLDGRVAGRIVIGALPLSRSALLPGALSQFRAQGGTQPVTVIDGTYDELLAGLRRGDIDVIIGAMRDPLPIHDVVQDRLYHDSLAIVAGPLHPLVGRGRLPVAALAGFPWVMARRGTPARDQCEAQLAHVLPPTPIVETGSVLLMRGLLQDNVHLGCVSSGQAAAEIATGALTALDVAINWPGRPIGITTRTDWLPTTAQARVIDLIRQVAGAYG